MDLGSLIAALSLPATYPFAVHEIEVRQTHISVVFLAGDVVYKIKKPVRLTFLDFSTLELRRKFCEEEVRLNRRLAPGVYLSVVPITCEGSRVSFEGAGEIIEWAVKMRRLPENATLEQRLMRDEIDAPQVRALAARVAEFHATAATSEHMAEFGRFETVARNVRENLEAARIAIGETIHQSVYDRLVELTEQTLRELQPLIDSRAARGVPRDTHGDLHLDHVYLFPERSPPEDLVIIDCIEFNERFRFADPVQDMAFLTMDLEFHGRRDLADVFAKAYFAATGDDEGRTLLPLYVSYRAAIRAKVEGLELAEPEIAAAERVAALQRARAHWLLALGELEAPSRRPCLVLVGGLPGTGKSTLARAIGDRAGFQVIRSDVVRKELAEINATESAAATYHGGIYTAEWTDRTYAECLRRAERVLFEGQRVMIDATFSTEKQRRAFLDAAVTWGVPPVLFLCDAEPELVKARLSTRRGDVSDADWTIYERAAESFEPPSPRTQRDLRRIDTGAAYPAVECALHELAALGLVSDDQT